LQINGFRKYDRFASKLTLPKLGFGISGLFFYLKKYTRCIPRRCALTFFSDPNSLRTIELAGHFSLDRKGYLQNDRL
jgi:hypothetical protein